MKKRPLIMVTKTSGSHSHSNKNISFPRAEFINYAFPLQDLYFLRQELECMLNFLLSTRAAPPTASPLQLLPRQLIEKCSVAWRILTHIHAHKSYSHTQLMALCTCLFLSECVFMCVFTPCVTNYSQTQPASLWFFSTIFIQSGLISFLPCYSKSGLNDYM